MLRTLYVTGAYGRKYRSKKAILEDLDANLDFKIFRGPYFSKSDIPAILEDYDCIDFCEGIYVIESDNINPIDRII